MLREEVLILLPSKHIEGTSTIHTLDIIRGASHEGLEMLEKDVFKRFIFEDDSFLVDTNGSEYKI